MNIDDIRSKIVLEQTCWACPAQWDAYYNGKIVGYIRLRYGCMTVECPDVGGELVYSMHSDDGLQGMFHSGFEEELFLNKALNAIAEWIIKNCTLPDVPKED